MSRHASCTTLATMLLAAAAGSAFAQTEKSPLAALSQSIRELTQRVSPAVVEILVNGYGIPGEERGHGVSVITRQRSSGSGVIVDPEGYVVTNAHVVEGAVSVKVLLGERGSRPPAQRLDAKIIGLDRESDLAVLKVDRKGLPQLRLANSDLLRQGDLVLAIGSPLGLRNSVSMGVVSSPARAVSDDNPMVYIQTDASINPGNSGGALVNMEGALVGINSFIYSQSGGNEGIGFAIPSNAARHVYQQLRRHGRVRRGEIGVLVENITGPMAVGLSLGRQSGLVAADVEPEGPAEKAGLKEGDVILTLDGRPMDTARQFENSIYRRQQGDQVRLEVQRGELRLTVMPVVREQAATSDPLAAMVTPEKNLVPRLGILVIEITKEVAALLELRDPYGLIIAAKSPDGQAQFIDLRPGDVIHAFNTMPVPSLEFFRHRIEELKPGDAVALQIERDGRHQYVAFEIE